MRLTNKDKKRPSISALSEYLMSKTATNLEFQTKIHSLLYSNTGTSGLGLIVSERLINMPVQIVPHMYRMLKDEIGWALEEVCV